MFRKFSFIFILLAASIGVAQDLPQSDKPASGAKPEAALGPKAIQSRKFVLDVVNSAVALPQSDQQDRLRVLSSAVEVISPIAPKTATQLSKEGIRIEAELIALGEKPAVSLFAAGTVDCKTATEFAQRIYPQYVEAAEQSLLGVLTKCPRQSGEIVRTRTDAALAQGIVAPRLLMALIEKEPQNSSWSQRVFKETFSSLPDKAGDGNPSASEIATMFASTAPKVDKDTVRDAGLKLYDWLGKQEDSSDKNLAINITAAALKEALGEEAYRRALERDATAQSVARNEGAQGESSREEEESVSVSQSMATVAAGGDQRDELKNMAPSLRARQAAAYGFAKGTSGDKAGAGTYFDVAFAAADEAWADRGDKNLAPMIQEVSEAAAQVDPMDALRRAQGLQDASAKAIGMIAVARVVMSKNLPM